MLTACESGENSSVKVEASSCKGIYYSRTSGALLKFNEFFQVDQNRCLTDNMPLSSWEKSSEAWEQKKITCAPQPGFASRTIVAANNYYSYRDTRILMDFDSTTGIYRKVVFGEDLSGKATFSRSKGCFYQRTATGGDAIYGKQLLIDTEVGKWASSEDFEPMEIFKYSDTATTLNMIRFDDSIGWDYRFCPDLSTPLSFCELLRDGNEMFFPVLTIQQQSDLLDEALLIGKQFNYITTTKSAFEILWQNVAETRAEVPRVNWKYQVIHNVDTPTFLDQSWRDFLLRNRPTMPNVNSPTIRPLCYSATQQVVLSSGGVSKILGEVCYLPDGTYSFVAN